MTAAKTKAMGLQACAAEISGFISSSFLLHFNAQKHEKARERRLLAVHEGQRTHDRGQGREKAQPGQRLNCKVSASPDVDVLCSPKV